MLVWARYGVQMVAMIAWLGPSMRLDMLRTKRLPLQLVRSIVLLVSSLLFVTALRSPPLAEATALMPWTDAALIIAAGLFGTLGHFLFILAFRHAPASAITPFTTCSSSGQRLQAGSSTVTFRTVSRSLAWPSSPAADFSSRCTSAGVRAGARSIR